MIVVLYGAVALAVVFAIAAAVVGREARRLDAEPPPATFDLDEATDWVGNHLPFEVSAVLSYDDVRRILEWNLDFLRVKGVPPPGAAAPQPADEVVVDRDQVAGYVLERANEHGVTFSQEHVEAVLDAQFEYFDAIGAIGPEASPDERAD
jgi:hypothetical protein